MSTYNPRQALLVAANKLVLRVLGDESNDPALDALIHSIHCNLVNAINALEEH